MTELNIKIEEAELQEILIKRLELKYKGQLNRLQKKMVDLENLVFSWLREDRRDIDNLKFDIQALKKQAESAK